MNERLQELDYFERQKKAEIDQVYSDEIYKSSPDSWEKLELDMKCESCYQPHEIERIIARAKALAGDVE